MQRLIWVIIALVGLVAAPVAAQVELSIYGGIQSSPPSNVSGDDPGGIGVFDFGAEWEGRSLQFPLYIGARVTWWQNQKFGWGLDYSHDKVYATDATLAANGLSQLQMSDGLNLLTINVYRRWKRPGAMLTPYVGAGVGVSVPYIHFDSGAGTTAGYQFGGPAIRWLVGVSYPVNDRWSVFGEYRGSYSQNTVDLVSGGSLSTDIISNTMSLGVSLGL